MIAKNYIRFPDMLRFQRELFHNGYKNQPRIMRAIECIFSFAPTMPQWVKDAKRLAKQLVKHWKTAQVVLNFAADMVRQSRHGYVWGNGPTGRTPFFEKLLAAGLTWDEIVNDDRYFEWA
jgi:hypothetical protein